MAELAENDARKLTAAVHVALVIGPRTMGHTGRVIKQLAIGLLDEPFGVTVVAPGSVEVDALPCPPARRIGYTPPRIGRLRQRDMARLTGELAEAGVEILHAMDGSAHALTRELSRRGDWPYLASALSLQDAEELSPLGPRCRAVLAASVTIRAALLNHQVAPAEMISLVRPGIHRLRQPHERPAKDHCWSILATGAMDSAEPLATILRAFAAVRQQRPDCVLFLLGRGRAERRLRSLVRSLELTHQVTFVDRLDAERLAGVLQAADVSVFPRSGGQLEMEVLTAMAAGVAVLVAEPCVGDFAIDGETVWSYESNDAADLTRKLGILIDNYDDASRLAGAALAYLAEHHSPARMVSSLAELYRRHALRGRTLNIS